MAKLKLRFQPEEDSRKRRPLTSYEINEIAITGQSVAAIIHIMAIYACDNQQKEEAYNRGIFSSVFDVLELLMEPVNDYLGNYAGEEAALEEEPEQTA